MRFAQCLQGSRNTGDTAPFRGLTVVGYNNVALTNGNQAVGITIYAVGGQPLDLTTVVPQGYEEIEGRYDNEGTWGDVQFQIIDSNGYAIKIFQWYRSFDSYGDEVWLDDGHWYNFTDVCDVNPGDATFNPGNGILATLTWDYGVLEGITLQNSGEAIVDAQSIALTNGNQLISVPVSFDCKLCAGQIQPAGYEEIEGRYDNEGTWGDIQFQIIDTNGYAVKIYQWYRSFDSYGSEEWEDDGHWYNFTDVCDVTEDNDVELKTGMAILATLTWDYGELEGITLEFPGIDE